METITQQSIIQDVLRVGKKRGKERAKILNKIAEHILKISTSWGFITFTREHLNQFVEGLESERTREHIVKTIIGILENNKKIKEDVVLKTYISYENKPLSSCDYGSYAVLMKKNGYKYNKDLCRWVETLPQFKQGVYTNSPCSVVKRKHQRVKKVYLIC
jgi:hypothetical protein